VRVRVTMAYFAAGLGCSPQLSLCRCLFVCGSLQVWSGGGRNSRRCGRLCDKGECGCGCAHFRMILGGAPVQHFCSCHSTSRVVCFVALLDPVFFSLFLCRRDAVVLCVCPQEIAALKQRIADAETNAQRDAQALARVSEALGISQKQVEATESQVETAEGLLRESKLVRSGGCWGESVACVGVGSLDRASHALCCFRLRVACCVAAVAGVVAIAHGSHPNRKRSDCRRSCAVPKHRSPSWRLSKCNYAHSTRLRAQLGRRSASLWSATCRKRCVVCLTTVHKPPGLATLTKCVFTCCPWHVGVWLLDV